MDELLGCLLLFSSITNKTTVSTRGARRFPGMTYADTELPGCEINVPSSAVDVKLPPPARLQPTLPTSVKKGSRASVVSVGQARQEAGRFVKRT